MAAIYSNFNAGIVTNNPLGSGDTTLNSTALASLPVVTAPDFMYLTLDPSAVNGAPEIVKVTAHTSSASSATIARAQQGTTARSHPVNTSWEHSLTRADADLWPKGALTSWTPTVTQSGSVTVTVTRATYQRMGRLVHCYADLAVTGGSGAANNVVIIGNLPATAASAGPVFGGYACIEDTSAGFQYFGFPYLASTTTMSIRPPTVSTNPSGIGADLGETSTAFTAALVNTDRIHFGFSYEAAADL